MALGDERRHWRIEALTTAATLIEQHGGTYAMAALPESDQQIFDEECRKLAERLENMAKSLGWDGKHNNESVHEPDLM
ncbi:hypothetical protein [Aliagarivorans taiwanensis]|uniref:hypothetical protein n=1 Tax=Aliagarivorans taiwanensis TaxID=561966 RepID=UPI00047A482F|nr:hypothetical protein [Aliagarivorans taiwanensis]